MRMADLIKAEKDCSHGNMVKEYDGRGGWTCCDCKRHYTDGDIEVLRELYSFVLNMRAPLRDPYGRQ